MALVFTPCAWAQQTDLTALAGPYFGQRPPGRTPEPFMASTPDLQQLHGMIRFSPDGKAAYWKPVWNPRAPIFEARLVDGRWTAPAVVDFSAPNQGDDVPFLTPDGRTIFFISQRPVDGEARRERIWTVTRAASVWSEPRLLTGVINTLPDIHWQLSTDRHGNLYFGVSRRGREGEIYCARFQDGRFLAPEKLGPEINEAGVYNYSPFVYPDGNTLLFTRGQKPARLFAAFRRTDGSWTAAVELNGLMHVDHAGNPAVTPDGKYLFFTGANAVTYWVDAAFIRDLKR